MLRWENEVSMPSWAWVVTSEKALIATTMSSFNALMGLSCYARLDKANIQQGCFNALMGLSCYRFNIRKHELLESVSMPSWAWVVTGNGSKDMKGYTFQCPHGLELLRPATCNLIAMRICFNALMGLSCYDGMQVIVNSYVVSMPSWAWVVTFLGYSVYADGTSFNALMGLSCYCKNVQYFKFFMILFMHPCYL